MNRRDSLYVLSALGLSPIVLPFKGLKENFIAMKENLLRRAIPSTGEMLPAIGLGTWQTFDAGDAESETAPLREVLTALVNGGGKVIDSSPMYGRSERVVGALSAELGLNDDLFVATKVWTTGKENGIRQMNESFSLLRRKQMDLMQIHNITDWQTHLPTLYRWKEQSKIRYLGITHYTDSAHDRLCDIIEKEKIDFVQVNYNLLDTHAEDRLFPLAEEKNVAVIVNRPFEEGALFRRVQGKTLPGWATELGCKSWAQFFLKFILSHPAVTCVIPGTSKPHHMLDNLGAGYGSLPDARQRREMTRVIS